MDGAAQHVTGLAGEAGSNAVKNAVPAAGKTGGKAVKKATPAAQKTAGDAAGSAGALLGDATAAAADSGVSTGSLTQGGLPAAPSVPVKGLPIG